MSLVTERVSMNVMSRPVLFSKPFFKCIVYFNLFLHGLNLFSCAPQGVGILGSPTKLQDIVDQSTKVAPFAYDLAVDTISYNSCISETVKSSADIHGLKIGVSEGFTEPLTGAVKSGLKLRTDFLQYVGKTFKPEYPNKTIQPSQIQKIIANSDYNKDAFIQFAIRQQSDYLAVPDLILVGGNNTKPYAQTPRDLTVFSNALYSGLLGYSLTKSIQFTSAGLVLNEGARVYNLSDSIVPVNLEATFKLNATDDESYLKPSPVSGSTENFGRAETHPQEVRDDFNSKKNLLTVTFGGDQNIPDGGLVFGDTTNHINLIKRPRLANSQSFDNSKAFGRGFQFRTGADLDRVGGRDLDRRARLRVARGACLARDAFDGEVARDGELVAFGEAVGHDVEQRVERRTRIFLGEFGSASQFGDEFGLVHVGDLLSGGCGPQRPAAAQGQSRSRRKSSISALGGFSARHAFTRRRRSSRARHVRSTRATPPAPCPRAPSATTARRLQTPA